MCCSLLQDAWFNRGAASERWIPPERRIKQRAAVVPQFAVAPPPYFCDAEEGARQDAEAAAPRCEVASNTGEMMLTGLPGGACDLRVDESRSPYAWFGLSLAGAPPAPSQAQPFLGAREWAGCQERYEP